MHEKKIIKTFKELTEDNIQKALIFGLSGNIYNIISEASSDSFELLTDIETILKNNRKYVPEISSLISSYFKQNKRVVVWDMVQDIIKTLEDQYKGNALEFAFVIGLFLNNLKITDGIQ